MLLEKIYWELRLETFLTVLSRDLLARFKYFNACDTHEERRDVLLVDSELSRCERIISNDEVDLIFGSLNPLMAAISFLILVKVLVWLAMCL